MSPHCAGVAWDVPTGQQGEQGRVLPGKLGQGKVLPGKVGLGQGPSRESGSRAGSFHSSSTPARGHREELGAGGVPRPPPQGISSPLFPTGRKPRVGSAASPRAAQLGASLLISSSGRWQRYCPISPIFHFLQGIFSLSHPHWRGPRQRAGSTLVWLGWGIKQQPQPHCVPLSVAHFHLLCSHEQLYGLCWVYLQWRERG